MTNKFSGENFVCDRGCNQLIFWKQNQNIFVNAYDGPGGHQGLRHACNNRQERYKTRPDDKFTNIQECPRCARKFDMAEFFDCTFCFKQCCQNCGCLFNWSVFKRNCPMCKDMRSRHMTMTKFVSESPIPDPKTGRYKRFYITRPMADIREEIELIVNCYRRLKASWDASGIKMKCVVSNCRVDVEDRSDYCINHIIRLQKA